MNSWSLQFYSPRATHYQITMKASLTGMILFLAALVGIAVWRSDGTLSLGFKTSWEQLLRFMPVLVVALLLAGFTEVLLPAGLVEKWLSDSAGFKGIAMAWVAGALTPGGSLVGMPLIVTLFQAGVGVGVLVTYMTSLALMSLVRLPLELTFYGWRLTALRMAVSVFLPPLAGLLAQVVAPLFITRSG